MLPFLSLSAPFCSGDNDTLGTEWGEDLPPPLLELLRNMNGASTLHVQILSESWGCFAPCASWRVSSLPFDTLGVKLGSTRICSALFCRHDFAQMTGLSAGQGTTPWLMGLCTGEWKETFYLRISVPQILEFGGAKNSPKQASKRVER